MVVRGEDYARAVPGDPHPLEFLIGTWEGVGEGIYPSVETFRYLEVLEIARSPKGFLTHGQRTRHETEGFPMHAELGYWRVPRPGFVELILSHPTGVTEVCEGVFGDGEVHVRSVIIGCSSSAKTVDSLERWYRVDGDNLTYRLSMGAVGHAHQPHLIGRLVRAD